MTVNNMVRNQMSDSMMRVASGQRINSAADDAAGLAIMEEMTTQLRGLDQGTRNTQDMQGLVRTAEGGLDTIGDSLQRIRELSVQAASDTNSPIGRQIIQSEINQLTDQIQSAVENVQFNNINLLDGSVQDFNTASGPDGTGMTVDINNMGGLPGLAYAIANFNVTGEFNINQIDAALNEVNSERANLGAMQNRMDYTINANNVMSLNMADARSRVGDADIAREMMAVQQERVMDEIQVMLQQQQQQQAEEQGQGVISPGAASM